MGLVTGAYMKARIRIPNLSIDDFVSYVEANKKKRTSIQNKQRFFQYAYAK